MKKFKGFTLLESLAVIVIIGIIATALYNMRMLGQDRTDYRKEAVNVMYKEITEMLKDFQRNKIRTYEGTEHEIDTFQIKMIDEEGNIGKLEAGYTYLYCVIQNSTENEIIVPCYDSNGNLTNGGTNLVGSGHYEYITLINSEKKYVAKKNIKNIDKFLFKSSGDTNIINMFKDGLFEIGYDYIENFDATIAGLVNFSSNETTTTEGQGGDFNYEQCASIWNACIDDLCPNNSHYGFRSYYYQQQCKRSKMKGITPQSMSVLQSRKHHGWRGFREEIQAIRGVGGVGIRKKMDGCLQTRGYNNHSCSASQRRTQDGNTNDGETTISYHEFTPEASEIDNFFSFSIYAAEKNGEQCNTTEGTEWKTRRPIGKITVNTITKTAIIERCNNDRTTNGINCGPSICE